MLKGNYHACLMIPGMVNIGGPFVGFTVTAAFLTSIVADHFGILHMLVHTISIGRIIGALLMVGGIALIARN